MKRCSRCKLWKTVGEYTRNKAALDGYSCYCTACRQIIRKEDYERNKKRGAARSRRNRYGISASQFALIKGRQGEACAICREPLKRGKQTHLDHCHETGRVRGILCHPCNKGLGFFKDDPTRLGSAIVYLKKRSETPKEHRLFDLDSDGAA